ncbi:MAG TPA: carboxypeptidase-like regulatory domain-containing protein [Terriglobia bacterium]|nr:carboxypeptidase-like regulatory domain-containing protein [Terriglobia bacterium]
MQRSASRPSRRSSAGARIRLCRLMLAALVSVVLLVARPAGAKEKKPVTRTITGSVLDQAENGIAGASVELTDLRTGKKVAIYSEQGGRYAFADLKPEDDYQIQASYKDQPSEVRKVTSLIREMKVVINLHIPPPKSE